MNICFMGGSQAGVIGALTLLAKGHKLNAAVSYFEELGKILGFLDVTLFPSVKNEGFMKALANSDILVSVHGREILKSDHLNLPKYGCINVHPYLYKYKGADPVARALREKNFKGSVGVHRMTEKIDEGEVIVEEPVEIKAASTADEIYNALYPYYPIAILKALDIIEGINKDERRKNRRKHSYRRK